ncbi:MAG: hypothetical protein KBS62_01530 [Oscillospiraceae bacterium]|nr:hypothetical protein [Candidatus Ruminococcus equi]
MRKVFSLLFALLFVLSFTIYAGAESSASFGLSCDTNIDNNRLFYMDVVAQNDVSLCSAEFTVSYDKNCFEYRKVTCADNNAFVKATEENGEVKIIFASSDAVNFKSKDAVCSLQFKSQKEGSSYMDIFCVEAVSEGLDYLNTEDGFQSEIDVNGKNVKVTKTQKKSKTSKAAEKSKISTIDETQVERTENFFENKSSNKINMILAFIALALLVCVLVFIGIVIGRKTLNKKENTDEKNKP